MLILLANGIKRDYQKVIIDFKENIVMGLFKKRKEETEESEDFIDKLSRQEFIKAETKFRHSNIQKLPRFNKESHATLGFILETLFDIRKDDLYWMHIFSSDFYRSNMDDRIIDDKDKIWNYDLFDAIIYMNDNGESVSKEGQNTTITIRYDNAYYKRADRDTCDDKSILYNDNSIILFLRNIAPSVEGTRYMRVSVMIPDFTTDDDMRASRSSNSPQTMSFVLAWDETDPTDRLGKYQQLFDSLVEKNKNGQELTEDENLILTTYMHRNSVGYDFGYAKWLLEQKRYFDALMQFLKVHERLKLGHDDVTIEVYLETCYCLGYCYNELEQFEKAYYYLDVFSSADVIGDKYFKPRYAEEYVNCLCNNRDGRAMGLMHCWIKELEKKEELSADETELYWFLWRRTAYLLIEMKEYDNAENLLNKLLKYPGTAEFAVQELEYLKKIRSMS